MDMPDATAGKTEICSSRCTSSRIRSITAKATICTCAYRLGVHEAGLGARIDVPTLEGPVGLRVPPGTQAGQRFVLTDRGVPRATGGRGNLIVEVQIVLPPLDGRSCP